MQHLSKYFVFNFGKKYWRFWKYLSSGTNRSFGQSFWFGSFLVPQHWIRPNCRSRINPSSVYHRCMTPCATDRDVSGLSRNLPNCVRETNLLRGLNNNAKEGKGSKIVEERMGCVVTAHIRHQTSNLTRARVTSHDSHPTLYVVHGRVSVFLSGAPVNVFHC